MFLSGKLGVSENDDTKQDYSIKKSEHMRHEMLFIERILGLRLSTLLENMIFQSERNKLFIFPSVLLIPSVLWHCRMNFHYNVFFF